MQSKNIFGLCFIALLMLGTSLAQTQVESRQTYSNTSTDIKQQSNSSATDKKPFPFNIPEESRNSPRGARSVACQYLTEPDAQSLTDKSVAFYTSTTSENQLNCMYVGPTYFLPSVDLKLETFSTVKQAQAAQAFKVKLLELENFRHPQNAFRIKTVSGIGDAAVLATSAGNLASVYGKTSKTVFEITVLDKKDKIIPINILKAVAKKVADNYRAKSTQGL